MVTQRFADGTVQVNPRGQSVRRESSLPMIVKGLTVGICVGGGLFGVVFGITVANAAILYSSIGLISAPVVWFFASWLFRQPKLTVGLATASVTLLCLLVFATPKQGPGHSLRIVPVWKSVQVVTGLSLSVLFAYALTALAIGALCSCLGGRKRESSREDMADGQQPVKQDAVVSVTEAKRGILRRYGNKVYDSDERH